MLKNICSKWRFSVHFTNFFIKRRCTANRASKKRKFNQLGCLYGSISQSDCQYLFSLIFYIEDFQMDTFLLVLSIVIVVLGLATGAVLSYSVIKTVARATKSEPNYKGFLVFAIFGGILFTFIALLFVRAFVAAI